MDHKGYIESLLGLMVAEQEQLRGDSQHSQRLATVVALVEANRANNCITIIPLLIIINYRNDR